MQMSLSNSVAMQVYTLNKYITSAFTENQLAFDLEDNSGIYLCLTS